MILSVEILDFNSDGIVIRFFPHSSNLYNGKDLCENQIFTKPADTIISRLLSISFQQVFAKYNIPFLDPVLSSDFP